MHFWDQNTFRGKKWNWWFDPQLLHPSLVSLVLVQMQKCNVIPMFTKQWKCRKKIHNNAQLWKVFRTFTKLHFWNVGYHYSGAGKSVPFCPLCAGEHFGAQNAFRAPNAFWAPKCILGPEMHFGVLFAPWPQMLMKPMVSASDFPLFGVKCENENF